MKRNEWKNLNLDDMKRRGEFLRKAFDRLMKKARRLQKVLGTAYDSDEMSCDFCHRALQDELFRPFVPDWEHGTTADKLIGRIRNAIVKYERASNSSGKRSETLNTDITKNSWAKPDTKKLDPVSLNKSKKNPKYKGTIMTRIGCGSE